MTFETLYKFLSLQLSNKPEGIESVWIDRETLSVLVLTNDVRNQTLDWVFDVKTAAQEKFDQFIIFEVNPVDFDNRKRLIQIAGRARANEHLRKFPQRDFDKQALSAEEHADLEALRPSLHETSGIKCPVCGFDPLREDFTKRLEIWHPEAVVPATNEICALANVVYSMAQWLAILRAFRQVGK